MAAITVVAGWGGCFPESRSINCLPRGEEALDEDLFINGNDPRRNFIPIEEVGYEPEFNVEFDLSLDDAVGLPLDQARIVATAEVILEDPDLFINMYREEIELESGFSWRDLPQRKIEARAYFIKFMRAIFVAMLELNEPTAINSKFCYCRCPEPRDRSKDKKSQQTVLNHLARFARQEREQKMAHAVALPIMRTLGY